MNNRLIISLTLFFLQYLYEKLFKQEEWEPRLGDVKNINMEKYPYNPPA
jgi:hypothetical protein